MNFTLPGLMIAVILILSFASIFETTPKYEAIKQDQEEITVIINDLNSEQNNTLFIAGYEIPMIGEILHYMGAFIGLIDNTMTLILEYIIAFFGLTSYIPADIIPLFIMIFSVLILFAVIAFIRLGIS